MSLIAKWKRREKEIASLLRRSNPKGFWAQRMRGRLEGLRKCIKEAQHE